MREIYSIKFEGIPTFCDSAVAAATQYLAEKLREWDETVACATNRPFDVMLVVDDLPDSIDYLTHACQNVTLDEMPGVESFIIERVEV